MKQNHGGPITLSCRCNSGPCNQICACRPVCRIAAAHAADAGSESRHAHGHLADRICTRLSTETKRDQHLSCPPCFGLVVHGLVWLTFNQPNRVRVPASLPGSISSFGPERGASVARRSHHQSKMPPSCHQGSYWDPTRGGEPPYTLTGLCLRATLTIKGACSSDG